VCDLDIGEQAHNAAVTCGTRMAIKYEEEGELFLRLK
jgi:hypothetical protein